MTTYYDPGVVVLSVLVAILASYTALKLASSVTQAKGWARFIWLVGGSVAMGTGIWSMHFVGMLAFQMPGMTMAYDVPLMLLSIAVAVGASMLALHVVSMPDLKTKAFLLAGPIMGIAIAGMHYIGMASMRMPARIEWDHRLVFLSIVIAVVASFAALWIAFQLRNRTSRFSSVARFAGSVVMGVAISGMHYTGMAAARFVHDPSAPTHVGDLDVSFNLKIFVISMTVFILAVALAGSIFERALARRTALAAESARLLGDASRALAALQEERELRERFVSSLTHDLRTPLTVAKLNAQMLNRNFEHPEKLLALNAKVIQGLSRADEMIRDLLDAHRISAEQQLPLQLEECDLQELVQQSVEELALVNGERFSIHVPGPVKGWWDPRYLRRLIENLCNNAVKYGFLNTPITIQIVDSPQRVELSVHNEGDAITPNEQSNLFQLFHRSKSAQVSGTKGWGIGLTLVKGVANSHGGEVQVRSEPLQGTTFTAILPRDARKFVSLNVPAHPPQERVG